MPLFLDCLPLYSWVDESQHPVLRRWSVSLPMLLTPPAEQPTSVVDVQPQRWVLDTGYTGEAFAWRSHLLEAGLDPAAGLVSQARTRTAFGAEERHAVRRASLWLVSNLPHLQDHPFRIPLLAGVVVRSGEPPDAEFHRPLVGTRALMRAGLTVKIDFARATVSVWTPGPWYHSLASFLRRLATGFARRPPPW